MTRPLSELQVRVLNALAETGEAMPANDIGYAIGAARVEGSGRGNGRGSGYRVFGPAQQIIPAIIGLRKRGLISWAERPDGMSGAADRINQTGRELLERDYRFVCVEAPGRASVWYPRPYADGVGTTASGVVSAPGIEIELKATQRFDEREDGRRAQVFLVQHR